MAALKLAVQSETALPRSERGARRVRSRLTLGTKDGGSLPGSGREAGWVEKWVEGLGKSLQLRHRSQDAGQKQIDE